MTHDAEREEAYAHGGTRKTVRAEGMNIPPLAVHAVPNGENAVDALVM